MLQQQARRLAFYTNSSSDDNLRKSPSRSIKPQIRRVDSNAPLSHIVAALEEDGCVVITDFTSPSSIDAAQQELEPYLDTLSPSDSEKPATEHTVTNTLPLSHLLASNEGLRSAILGPPLIHSVAAHFLTLSTTHYAANNPVATTAQPALSNAVAQVLRPSQTPPPLSRPDAIHHHRHLQSSTYTSGRDVALHLIVPTSDTSPATGAPRVVPGSHLWSDGPPDFDAEHGIISVEMEKGDALITLGSLYQASGSFRNGEKAETMMFYHVSFCNGVTRPEVLPLLKLGGEGREGE